MAAHRTRRPGKNGDSEPKPGSARSGLIGALLVGCLVFLLAAIGREVIREVVPQRASVDPANEEMVSPETAPPPVVRAQPQPAPPVKPETPPGPLVPLII